MLKKVYYYDSHKKQQTQAFAAQLKKMIGLHWNYGEEIQILCIGTDKVCGDSLGPFVGHYLSKLLSASSYSFGSNAGRLSLYGTLQSPLHAINLSDTLDSLSRRSGSACTIVVDASLGTRHPTGCVTLANEPLQPGEGVNKKLPLVGQIAITGIVGSSKGSLSQSQLALHQTRLYDLILLSEFIAEGIAQCIHTL